ncbi:hydroxymethylpyrimidine/phosphomethylpyrimidine kinase Thi20p [Monosporozyma unispora]|nr:trifunctional hydroxymethylpyrimidine kinase/phosphomethylpyrimidine kinase/thiaminase [Kazachstania unispora]
MSYTTLIINAPPPYLSLSQQERLPVVMTVAGSDSSGGAGIEADVKAITAHKCYAMTCASALTIQTPVSVYGIHLIPKNVITQILDVNLRDMECDVIKTGMLTVDAIEALSDKLNQLGPENRPKLVIDPVLVATSGSPLAGEELVSVIKEKLSPLADILTPNIPECFKLIGEEREINHLEDILQLAKDVQASCKSANVLVKGGHIPWKKTGDRYITDVLLLGKEKKFIVFKGNYTETTHTHGTGCTLASSIASNLARGYSLAQSVYGGIEYVQNAVAIGCDVTKPSVKENGPINHVYAINIPLERMIGDECFGGKEITPQTSEINLNELSISKDLPIIRKDFVQYLHNHPKVKPHWESYINHEFVKKIADGSLEHYKFRFFVEQDYAYLVDYGRVHCIAASKAPTIEDMEKELSIVGNLKEEMENHKERLIKHFGVKDESYFERITRGQALKNYSRYFKSIAERGGNWAELSTSLCPCLMGYGEALNQVKSTITTTDPIYQHWLGVYSSEWYHKEMDEGRIMMNEIAATYPPEHLETLITIYAQVCELETKFWDAALNYEEQ